MPATETRRPAWTCCMREGVSCRRAGHGWAETCLDTLHVSLACVQLANPACRPCVGCAGAAAALCQGGARGQRRAVPGPAYEPRPEEAGGGPRHREVCSRPVKHMLIMPYLNAIRTSILVGVRHSTALLIHALAGVLKICKIYTLHDKCSLVRIICTKVWCLSSDWMETPAHSHSATKHGTWLSMKLAAGKV